MLVFSQFTSMLDILIAKAESEGLKCLYLSGKNTSEERRDMVNAFQSGEYSVFFISLKAGGTGLNLRYVDPKWDIGAAERLMALGVKENSVVFESARRLATVPVDEGFCERACVAALHRVVLPIQRCDLHWTVGHGESAFDAYDAFGMSDIARELTREGYVNARLDAVQAFVDDRASLASLRNLLTGVRDLERLIAKVDAGRANPRDLKGLATSLRPLPDLLEALASLEHLEHLAHLGPQPDIVDLIDRSVVEDPPVLLTDGGFIAPGYDAELDDLRVHHEKLYLVRRRFIKQGHDHRVDADRFTGTGGTGDQQMRHFRKVGKGNLAGDVAAERHGELRFGVSEFLGVDDFADGNDGYVAVRHLDADGGFIGDRRFDTNACRREIQSDIVGKTGDLADLDTGAGLEFITGDGRTAADVDDLCLHPEALERRHEKIGVLPQFLGDVALVGMFHLLEDRLRRKSIGKSFEIVHDLGDLFLFLFGDGAGSFLRRFGIRRRLFHGAVDKRLKLRILGGVLHLFLGGFDVFKGNFL